MKKEYRKFNFMYSICLMIEIFLFSLIIFNQFYHGKYKEYLWFLILFFVLIVIINLILIIKFSIFLISKENIIEINKKLINLTFLVVLLTLTLTLMTNQLLIKFDNENKKIMINQAQKLISLSRNLKEDNIYKLKDLKQITSINKNKFNLKYTNNSYVTTFNKKIYICLSNEKYSIKGTEKKLEIIKENYCKYKFNNKEATLYLEEKLKEKYNINFKAYDCYENHDFDSVFNKKSGYTCNIKTDNKNKEYTGTVYNDDLTFKDTYK